MEKSTDGHYLTLIYPDGFLSKFTGIAGPLYGCAVALDSVSSPTHDVTLFVMNPNALIVLV